MNLDLLKSLGEFFLFEGSFLLISIIGSILIDKWIEIFFNKVSQIFKYSREGFFVTFIEILIQFLVVGLFQIVIREIWNTVQLSSTLFTEAGTVGFSTNITRLFYSFIALGSQKYLKDRFNRLVSYLQDLFNIEQVN